jgi:hypothetical protein
LIGHDFVDFERGADEVTDRAIAWLGDRSSRWFLFAHYFDPHWPYEPAAGWETMTTRHDRIGADRHLGRLRQSRDIPIRTLAYSPLITAGNG